MQKIRVTYRDGRTTETAVTPRAEVDFERKYDISAANVSDRNEYVYFIAWRCLELDGNETRSYEDFLSVLDSVALVRDEPVDPTNPAPRATDSSG